MKAESNHDEEKLKLDRINTWTKRRNKMLQKIITDKRMKTAYKNEQNKITVKETKENAGSVILPIITK